MVDLLLIIVKMSPELETPPELTPDQLEKAKFFIDSCGLERVADMDLEMFGQSGTVRYGLGRCAEYLLDLTPAEINDMVMTKIAQQKASGAEESAR